MKKRWRKINPQKLPDTCKIGPFLVTNNLKARNAQGQKSNVWLCRVMLHHDENLGVWMFDDHDAVGPQRLSHYMPLEL